ncbi:hypothetical protein MHUMG1_05254 [Metarhizium humberi]|uniref:Uncharacterized protein n=1 Tax=Metarhizium humberi TaxID=2596975 RepID=A0A9P8MB62_9HYPO|nr:hypothetical protein MHUMG1_05254 [Metarhizium humberi]
MDERQKCIEQEQEQLGAARGCQSSMLEALEASVHQAAGEYSLELLASYKAQGPDPAPPAAPPPKGVAAAMERLLRVPSRHAFSLACGWRPTFPKHKDHDQLINPPRHPVYHDSTCPSGFQGAPAWGELELGLQLGELLGELTCMDSFC